MFIKIIFLIFAPFKGSQGAWGGPAPRCLFTPQIDIHFCAPGLGGAVCGATCPKMMPVGLQSALNIDNASDVEYGQPRVGVCPTLCDNHLGKWGQM